ncbi:MAG: glycosyl hydrolase 115 family protein, partial [Phycisphaeraceae bacterium]
MTSKHAVMTSQSRVVDETGRPSVAYAHRALARDMAGKLATTAPDGGTPIVLRIDADLPGFDRWRVVADASGIVITGSDELGCVHGVYDFAERFLEADPMQWITRITPSLISHVEVPAGTWESPARTFRHRGFFFNDEDLLVGFQRKTVSDGFNPEVWERLFETLLRLGGTCVIPGTNIFSDEKQIRLASEMGLYIAQHHAEPVGCPTYHCWPRQLPYSLTEHEDVFVMNWRRAIERQAAEKVIWTLGFRGFLDAPFWHSDPTLGPDADDRQKAAVINRAVALQHRLVLEHRPDASHEFVFYCRGEMFPLLEQGLLEWPAGTTLLLTPDQLTADATRSDRFQASSRGLYAWANFFNRRSDMRIMSRSPIDIARTMNDAVAHGHTDVFLLNVGNLREKGFHVRQYMKLAKDHAGGSHAADGEAWFAAYARKVL